MAWEHHLFETRTGIPLGMVELSTHRWGTRQNGFVSEQSTIPTAAADIAVPAGGWDAATLPWATSILTCWDDRPVYAAPIYRRRENVATGEMVINHSELWRLLARRYIWGVADWAATNTLVLDGRTKRGLVRSLVTRAAVDNDTASPRWPLPVIVPDPEPGPHHRTFYAYHFDKAMDIVEDLISEVDAPDLAFVPRWSATGRVEWVAEIGTPSLTGPGLSLTAGAPASPVSGLVYDEDATDQYTGTFALGEGTEVDMLVGKGPSSITLDLPVMDAVESHKTLTTQAQVDAQAQGHVAQAQVLRPAWSFSVEQAAALDAGVKVGSIIDLYSPGGVIAAEGVQNLRVVGMSGDLSESVRLEVVAA